MSSEHPENRNDNNSSKALSPGEGLGEVDLNCDMGEGMDNDALIMPFISSANIACGYHAGDENTMRQTIELALTHQVAVGAHVSFPDRDNFGRKEMNLPLNEIYDLIQQQLVIFKKVTDMYDTRIIHIKPHGALYNMSARNVEIADVIARSVKDFDESLHLFGLSRSHSIQQAKAIGLKTVSEVFADRAYEDDGSLASRSRPYALIEDTDKVVRQVLQMIHERTVTGVSGKKIPILAETICIHGDGKHAVEFAAAIHEAIKK